MSELVRICGRAELPAPGQVKEIQAGNTTLCVANVNGEFTALGNECPHRHGPLGQGTIEDGYVICPWHAWAFDVKSGISSHSPNAKVEVFPVKVLGEDVLVDLLPSKAAI
jgi:nitrite reductase (NADH) small subunit